MTKPTLFTLPFEIREKISKYTCDDSESPCRACGTKLSTKMIGVKYYLPAARFTQRWGHYLLGTRRSTATIPCSCTNCSVRPHSDGVIPWLIYTSTFRRMPFSSSYWRRSQASKSCARSRGFAFSEAPGTRCAICLHLASFVSSRSQQTASFRWRACSPASTYASW